MEDETVTYANADYDLSLKDTPLPNPVTVTPPETFTHHLWHIVASVVQVIVIAMIFALALGIVALFTVLPAFIQP